MISLIITVSQIVFATALIIVVLLQQKGAGLSGAFGGSDAVFSARRGIDKILFRVTIIIAALFIFSGVLDIFF